MLVVTNTYANKMENCYARFRQHYWGLAHNRDVETWAEGSGRHIENFERRVRGSEVRWSVSWDSTFNAEVMSRIKKFFDGIRPASGPVHFTMPPEKKTLLKRTKPIAAVAATLGRSASSAVLLDAGYRIESLKRALAKRKTP